MKNDEIDLTLKKYSDKRTKAKTKEKKFLSKKHLLNNDFHIEQFEDSISVSSIENIEEQEASRNSKNNCGDISFDKDLIVELDNFSDEESKPKKIKYSNESIHLDLNSINFRKSEKKGYKKKKTKEDLDNTPLPLFNCIYCTDEKIVFHHFINNYLSENYLYLTSVYDINSLNKLISDQPLIDNGEENERLLNLIVKNTEYINKYFSKDFNESYFKSNLFKDLYKKNSLETQKKFKQNIRNSLAFHKKEKHFIRNNKITKSSINNNKYLLNTTSTLANNLTLVNEHIDQFSRNYINNNISNISINFISLSMNNNDIFINNKENNLLHNIDTNTEKKYENINCVEDKDDLMDIIKFDLIKKISKNEIEWDKECYNIWNPEIDSDFEEEEENDDSLE